MFICMPTGGKTGLAALGRCGKADVTTYPTRLAKASESDMRIDHVFVSEDIADALRDAHVVDDKRAHLASDYSPVVAESGD